MCLAMGGSGVSYPDLSPRDTSNELIKSNYPLSEENKKKNEAIITAKNKSKSLVNFGNEGVPQGSGVTFSGTVPSSRAFNTQQATGFGMNL